MLKNTKNQYGSVSKCFHWGVFILVALMLICGFFMEDLPDSMQGTTYMLHKSTGILILGLIILRLFWRWINITPVLPSATPVLLRFAAHLVHAFLYILLIAMPISGWILSTAAGRIPAFYGLINMPFPGIEKSKEIATIAGNAHEFIAYALLFVIIVHIAAGLKHHFMDKDDILIRMMPNRNNKN